MVLGWASPTNSRYGGYAGGLERGIDGIHIRLVGSSQPVRKSCRDIDSTNRNLYIVAATAGRRWSGELIIVQTGIVSGVSRGIHQVRRRGREGADGKGLARLELQRSSRIQAGCNAEALKVGIQLVHLALESVAGLAGDDKLSLARAV